MDRLDKLRSHRDLLHEAKRLGAVIRVEMTSAMLQQAIHNRRIEILRERGFVVGATVKLGERTIKITKIVLDNDKLEVTVHYWIEAPWTNNNNKGRANHRSAKEFLQKAKLVG